MTKFDQLMMLLNKDGEQYTPDEVREFISKAGADPNSEELAVPKFHREFLQSKNAGLTVAKPQSPAPAPVPAKSGKRGRKPIAPVETVDPNSINPGVEIAGALQREQTKAQALAEGFITEVDSANRARGAQMAHVALNQIPESLAYFNEYLQANGSEVVDPAKFRELGARLGRSMAVGAFDFQDE